MPDSPKLSRTPVLEFSRKLSPFERKEERSYCKSRILTDLRPIFSDDESAEQIAALIRHTSHSTFIPTVISKSVAISIDTRGLSELVTAITRAAQKGSVARRDCAISNLQLIDFEETKLVALPTTQFRDTAETSKSALISADTQVRPYYRSGKLEGCPHRVFSGTCCPALLGDRHSHR